MKKIIMTGLMALCMTAVGVADESRLYPGGVGQRYASGSPGGDERGPSCAPPEIYLGSCENVGPGWNNNTNTSTGTLCEARAYQELSRSSENQNDNQRPRNSSDNPKINERPRKPSATPNNPNFP